MSNIFVIYHRADFDGIFCCEIARRYFGTGATYIGWDYGDAVPEIPPTAKLYMLDISVEGLMDHPDLTWIDHHKTAIAKYGPRPGVQLDGVAACRLAWRWFNHRVCVESTTLDHFRYRQVEEPHAVTLAGEYDIWDKRDPDAELFQHGLRTGEINWDLLLSSDREQANAYVEQLLERGAWLQYARAQENKSIITRQGFTLKWEGLTFIACNAARFNSLLFTAALLPEHDACLGFAWDGGKGKWKVSLYGVPGKPDVDLSAIAVRYGGGGRKQACGFECETLPFPLGRVDPDAEGACGEVQRVEVQFPFPVALPSSFGFKLDLLVDEVCDLYEKTHPGRVMWPAGHGAKPIWSRTDAAFLGRTPDPDAPASGEPTWDDTVYQIDVSERERYAESETRKSLRPRPRLVVIEETPVGNGGAS